MKKMCKIMCVLAVICFMSIGTAMANKTSIDDVTIKNSGNRTVTDSHDKTITDSFNRTVNVTRTTRNIEDSNNHTFSDNNINIIGNGSNDLRGADMDVEAYGGSGGNADASNSVTTSNSADNSVNSANSNNSELTVNQNFEAKRDHIQGPAMLKSDSKFKDSKYFMAKIKMSIWDKVKSGLYTIQAKKVLSTVSDSDIEIKKAVLFEKEYRTNFMNKGISGEFMGYLIVFPSGNDVTTSGMEAKAVVEGTKLGATHMRKVYKGYGGFANGSSWNVGLGGGASIMNKGEDVVIAPNGGLGIGAAHASNEMLPEMVFELYWDASVIRPLD